MASLSQAQEPSKLIAVRSCPGPWNWIVNRDAGGAKLQHIAPEIVRLHAEIDQTLAFLQRVPPAVVEGLTVESDNLEVRAVGQGDKHIVAAHRMLAPWNDGEAEPLIVFGGLLEVTNDNNDVINPLKH
jgi:hypothetical protein